MKNPGEIISLNQEERDAWVVEQITKLMLPNEIVLDIGAGTSPYREYLKEQRYISHDFGQYEGVKLGGSVEYAHIDIRSDITNIPLESGSIDHIICTEVLEHVPRPLDAISEISRLLRIGGYAIITAPFTSGLHQEPYHYYAGFSPYFYEYASINFGLKIKEINQHGGFLRLMAQESMRLLGVYEGLSRVGYNSKIQNINTVLLEISNELLALDKVLKLNNFSIGYHVVFEKNVEYGH
jgi:SAM-dependent methyltransferase